jgi:DNA-binding NarL/FixJ family response regulator
MNVIIADSNDLIRIGLRTILSAQRDITISGEAVNNEELLEQLNAFGASVVIIDYTSPGFDINIVPKIQQKHKRVRFLAITPEQSAQTLVDALRSGITSYIKKDCDLSEIVNAVSETAYGNKFFCGQILEAIQKANIDVNDLDFDSFTCEAVISESCFLLKATYLQEILMSMIEVGAIKTQFQFENNVTKIQELMLRYGSVPMSFADACLVRMAEENPEYAILTIDSDFTIYRKNRNETIPIIIPNLGS